GFLATAPVWLARIAFKMGLYGDHNKFDYSYQLFDKEISSHQKSLDLNTKRDYIDGYLMEMDANCRTFFGAGSVTIRTITEWMLLFAVRYTEHQKRIHSEIDSVVGRDRSPCYADRLHMPSTQAFINEVFRLKTLEPLTFRCTTDDTTVLGQFIPKGTRIMGNIWAVHNDPKVWHKPQDFNPNRFLTSDGKELLKFHYFIPFTMGRRNCAGEGLARVERSETDQNTNNGHKSDSNREKDCNKSKDKSVERNERKSTERPRKTSESSDRDRHRSSDQRRDRSRSRERERDRKSSRDTSTGVLGACRPSYVLCMGLAANERHIHHILHTFSSNRSSKHDNSCFAIN
ncbi:unnamed protein product, partial [Oppiella nova]